MAEANNTVRLESSDEEIFVVEIGPISKVSATIKMIIEVGGWGEKGNELIKLRNVNSVTLKKVLEWVEFHKDDEPAPAPPAATYDDEDEPVPTLYESWHTGYEPWYTEHQTRQTTYEDLVPWDKAFFNTDRDTLHAITMAARYMDIQELMQSACKVVAHGVNQMFANH